MIRQKAIELNDKIHYELYQKSYFYKIEDYNKIFTSLDLIEDSQSAIEEFSRLDENLFPKRSTLYIYGVLQSLYCQQNAAFQIYLVLKMGNSKRINDFFNEFNFDQITKDIRDDIAGHPSNRKNGKEFYFISKGPNTKYNFSYAGYKPEFQKVDVNLLELINKQNEFINGFLDSLNENVNSLIKKIK